MAGAAAIFDLDRTLLRTSSTPALNQALFETRTGPPVRAARPGPDDAVLQRLRRDPAVDGAGPGRGAGRPGLVGRRGAQGGRAAADRLEKQVLPYVPALLDSHRRPAGVLVLATTTPYDLVEPLARRLGFDEVIATRYASGRSMRGRRALPGPPRGRLRVVAREAAGRRAWAEAEGVDLRQSWAYSDSVYDLPLLAGRRAPHGGQPRLRLHAAATLRRWPVVHLDSPAGVPKLLGAEPMDVVRRCCPSGRRFRSPDSTSPGRRTSRGAAPAIVAANHRSYFDVDRLRAGGVRGRPQPAGAGQEGAVRRARSSARSCGRREPFASTGRVRAEPPTRPPRRPCATARC